jgi:hypothetical protein
MPCNHRFYNELAHQNIDYKPECLIIGTFNPEWPQTNYAEWFYGRTDNNYFWDILPRMFSDEGLRSSSHTQWKQYCRTKKIALTDLLASIDDADILNEVHSQVLGKYTDTALASKFNSQVANPILPLLRSNSCIRSVYLTTLNKSDFWQRLWSPIEEYCDLHGIWCRKLMTPSKGARFSMSRASGIQMPDFIYNDWNTKWNRYE